VVKTPSPQISHAHGYDPGLVERLLFNVAKKWIAGFSRQDALTEARTANRKGMSAIINFLGEDLSESEQIEATVKEYSAVLELLHARSVDGSITVKPTQVGLEIGYEHCLKNLRRLIYKAKAHGIWVWIDMESLDFTDSTIQIYLDLLEDYAQIGLALQSCLKRSASDLLHLMEKQAIVRLVKGAYHESEQHAFHFDREIRANFVKLMELLFANSDSRFAIATHDSKLISDAIRLAKTGGSLNSKRFEFQLLMGIRDELKLELVADGYCVSQYIPYGTLWLPYSLRRLRERKMNLLLLARSLLQS